MRAQAYNKKRNKRGRSSLGKYKAETVRVRHIPAFAERERFWRRHEEMPCLIFGPYVPKRIQHLVESELFKGAACEIVRHDDPRLTIADVEPQTIRVRGPSVEPRPLRVPQDEASFESWLFVHVNYFGIDEGRLIITVWERGSAPPAGR